LLRLRAAGRGGRGRAAEPREGDPVQIEYLGTRRADDEGVRAAAAIGDVAGHGRWNGVVGDGLGNRRAIEGGGGAVNGPGEQGQPLRDAVDVLAAGEGRVDPQDVPPGGQPGGDRVQVQQVA